MNNIKFLEKYSQHDMMKSITIEQGNVIDKYESKLENNATRIIDSNNKMGFHVSSGKFNEEKSYISAKQNAFTPATIPSVCNKFVNLEYLDDVTPDCSLDEYSDYLKLKMKGLTGFHSKIAVEESHVITQLENSYGANTYSDIKRVDIDLELRDINTKRLLISRKYNSRDFIRTIEFLSTISNIPRITKKISPKRKKFIISPNILLEFLYPLQNLLLKGISVTNEISKALTIIEDNNGIIQIPFDDEGIKTEKKLICKNGNIIPTSFKNLEDGVSSGNGFRKDYRRKPKKAPLI